MGLPHNKAQCCIPLCVPHVREHHDHMLISRRATFQKVIRLTFLWGVQLKPCPLTKHNYVRACLPYPVQFSET